MFAALVLRELRYHLLTYRFSLSAVLLSVLVIGSVVDVPWVVSAVKSGAVLLIRSDMDLPLRLAVPRCDESYVLFQKRATILPC